MNFLLNSNEVPAAIIVFIANFESIDHIGTIFLLIILNM